MISNVSCRTGCRPLLWLLFLLLLQLLLAGGGCATRAGDYYLRDDIDLEYMRQIAVLSLANNSRDEFAPEMVRDIIMTRVLHRRLFDVVDKGLVDSRMREEVLDPGQPLDAVTLQRLGRHLQVQGVLLGTVDVAAEQRKGPVTYPELALTLRLLDVESGLVIWQAGGNADGDSFSRRLFGLAARDRYQVARGLVDELLATIPR
ncbi:hypothetical protein [Desulfurivibrio alkaliphilus]|uniref:Lipoprotein n=1 Tax=Desulfurivibrio alkaliphilus (strain DSM 19089 / UNIQEM U267 / AHT2) TaxID=589865 RepID=D6Z1N8_DESAT|nr:hypothetical protein [Desulfurivibrio alkaliphilus]ADH85463.1 hypothetical protein DaAHT2_0759 [Desulfurivibrio alkaliphilus AHT 2]